MQTSAEVIVIGAGAAGLVAACELGKRKFQVEILEARDRVGGRIYTRRDRNLNAPIEFGAEFVHGKPPEIWKRFSSFRKTLLEADGDNWCSSGSELSRCNFFDQVDKVLKKMDDKSSDESFLKFLARCWPNPQRDQRLEEAKRRATAYVSGFNAADPDLVGMHWLVESMRAEERIDGERAFRPRNGYQELLDSLEQELRTPQATIHTNAVVEAITWRPGSAQVTVQEAEGVRVREARKVLITVPLAVLQADAGQRGAIRFSRQLPAQKLAALEKLEMGKVIRVVFCFRSKFWEGVRPLRGEDVTLSRLSFLLTEEELFPTWWTRAPDEFPMITGWAPFRAAQQLSGKSESYVIQEGLAALSRVLRIPRETVEREFERAYFHDWQNDPFSRGAYSYGKVGSDGAQQTLAEPLDHTLFFAGEATDTTGNNGTVHGAIASGLRAAKEIMNSGH